MEHAAPERRGGLPGVVEVALHHVVAAHHDLAHGLAVAGDVAPVLPHHADRVGHHHRHALARQQPRALGRLLVGPLGLPLADGVRAVGLGEAVDVQHGRPEGLGLAEHRGVGRRGGGHHHQAALERVGRGGVHEHREHGRRAAQVGDALLVDQAPDLLRAHRAQAHLRAAGGHDRPGVAPAVAVEHRQGPEVDRVHAVAGGDVLAERVEVGAAVRVHHALRLPGGARRVVDRDRRVLVVDRPRQRVVGPALQQLGVGDARQAVRRAGVAGPARSPARPPAGPPPGPRCRAGRRRPAAGARPSACRWSAPPRRPGGC